MDFLVCHKRNDGNFPETEETISETTIDLAGLEQAVLHFYNHDSYLAAHDWIEIHPILQGRPHQAVPIPPALYRSRIASSAELQKGLNVVQRLTNQLDMLKTDRAFLAIDRGDLWALQRALSASVSVSQHHDATPTGEKINGVPVATLKEIEEKLGLRSPNEIQHVTTTMGQSVNFTHTLGNGEAYVSGYVPDEPTVNGVTFNAADPLIGYWDRIVASGDPVQIAAARNLPFVVLRELGESLATADYKKHLVENGYASQETVDTIWPEPKEAAPDDLSH